MKRLQPASLTQTGLTVGRQSRALMFFAAALFLVASGCAAPAPEPRDGSRTLNAAEDRKTLDLGIEAFQTGDYRRAGKIFEQMRGSNDPLIARKALYGLSCARLALAESPSEYAAARSLWQTWNRQAPLKYRAEDPRMLAPLLARLPSPAAVRKRPPEKKQETRQSDLVPMKRYQDCQGKIRELKTRLGNMEAQKQLLQYYVDYTAELQKEIWNLKHKINSLEAIDKKILEKKKELSSP